MKRKAKFILKGRLKEANHFRHLDDIRSERIGAPNMNTKGGTVASGECLSKRGLDLTRAHCFGVLHNSPQIVRTVRVPDLTDLALTLATRSTTRAEWSDPSPVCPKSGSSVELPPMPRPEERLSPEEVRMIGQE